MGNDDRNTAIYIAFDETEPFDPARPERNLLRAIILTAMSDLKKPGDLNRKATEYFLSPDDEYVFSFQSICTLLDIDPDRILVVTGLRSSMYAPQGGAVHESSAASLVHDGRQSSEVEVIGETAAVSSDPAS